VKREHWELIEQLLAYSWRSPRWDSATATAYRFHLDRYEPEEVLLAIQRLAQRGGSFRPSAAEVVAAIGEQLDSELPSWTEFEAALYGGGHCDHEAFRLFVDAKGDRLRLLPVNCPDYGHLYRREVRQDWERFAERYTARKREGRALAALGRRTQGELRRMDPLAALAPGNDEEIV
jgi:hypothetical protein